jgi:hypothetical protein
MNQYLREQKIINIINCKVKSIKFAFNLSEQNNKV